MSANQRKEINKKRREKRRLEKEAVENLARMKQQAHQQKVDEEERVKREAKRLMEKWVLEKENNSKASTSAERKRLSRARLSISKDPVLYALTVSDLVNKASPKKKKLLERSLNGHNKLASHISEALASKMKNLRKSRKKKDLDLKRTIASTLRVTKKYRLQGQVCKAFKITPKLLNNKHKHEHKRKVSPDIEKSVHSYYERFSIVLPDKRFVSKKTQIPFGFLKVPVSTIYSTFRKENPTISLGLSKFMSMRPAHIKLRSSIKYRGCLCEYCANMELKLEAINNFAHQHHMQSPFSSVYSMNKITMCDKGDNKYNKLQCIQRKCSYCGVKRISQCLKSMVEKQALVTWKKWERKTCLINGKLTSKMVLDKKQTSTSDLLQETEIAAETFAQHLFSASWQSTQYSNISRNPPQGWVVMVFDFAENYSCRYQDEIQSVHWGHESATLHPVVATYRCPNCDYTMTHSLVMISQDNTHDHHAVHKFTEIAIDYLQVKLVNITKVVRFSDGAPSQYKSRGPFMDVSYGHEDYGISFQHEFFGSRHGKGPSDGESGILKRLTTDAVMAGATVVQNAHDMYTFLKANATRPIEEVPSVCYHFKRNIFWIENIPRNRDRQATKTVVGTRLIHSVVSVKPKVIATRSLSCFCPPCVKGENNCQNMLYVEPYVNISLEKGVSLESETSPTSAEKIASSAIDTDEIVSAIDTDETVSAIDTDDPTAKEIKLQSYICCVYDKNAWIGLVENMSKEHGDFFIRFMHPHGPSKVFHWPTKIDACWVSERDILCLIDAPSPCSSGRMYKISNADSLRITSVWKKWQTDE